MLEEMDGGATDNEQSLQYEKGLHTFSILFTRWMDSNDWSHPIMVSLAKAAMGGTGWLHSSQISGLRHAKLRSPGPRTFIAIERLNYHLYQYTEHKTLIPGTEGSNFYANALPILEDGKVPELGWWFEVFCGQRIPSDERLLSQYVSGYDAETCSKNWGRLLRKLMSDNGLDIFEDLGAVIQKHYPAGDAHRVEKLIEVAQSRAVWTPDELLQEIAALTALSEALGGPTDEEDLLTFIGDARP
jgi:hypothetical protein